MSKTVTLPIRDSSQNENEIGTATLTFSKNVNAQYIGSTNSSTFLPLDIECNFNNLPTNRHITSLQLKISIYNSGNKIYLLVVNDEGEKISVITYNLSDTNDKTNYFDSNAITLLKDSQSNKLKKDSTLSLSLEAPSADNIPSDLGYTISAINNHIDVYTDNASSWQITATTATTNNIYIKDKDDKFKSGIAYINTLEGWRKGEEVYICIGKDVNDIPIWKKSITE